MSAVEPTLPVATRPVAVKRVGPDADSADQPALEVVDFRHVVGDSPHEQARSIVYVHDKGAGEHDLREVDTARERLADPGRQADLIESQLAGKLAALLAARYGIGGEGGGADE